MKPPVSPPSPETRARMRATRRAGTHPENALCAELAARKLAFETDMSPLPGLRTRADLVFTNTRVAVYVDGCFWHACPEHRTQPRSNSEFWRLKIEQNVARDRRADLALREGGWLVLRVWEHEEMAAAADRIAQAVRAREEAAGEPR